MRIFYSKFWNQESDTKQADREPERGTVKLENRADKRRERRKEERRMQMK